MISYIRKAQTRGDAQQRQVSNNGKRNKETAVKDRKNGVQRIVKKELGVVFHTELSQDCCVYGSSMAAVLLLYAVLCHTRQQH